jgi:transposase
VRQERERSNQTRCCASRKTDVKDAEWIADLQRHGLSQPSYVPPPELRELRSLLRYRVKLVNARSAERNRICKLLESANIKMRRESHVRFCEGVGVKFPRATRLTAQRMNGPTKVFLAGGS